MRMIIAILLSLVVIQAAVTKVDFDKCKFCVDVVTDVKEYLVKEGNSTEKFLEDHCIAAANNHDWKKLVCETLLTAVEELLRLIKIQMNPSEICLKLKAC
ncbi:unnamed protein product [Dracunculus medinensis]|uniref:Saposin B-type domain-containing protein n=1 Tax=Dracunculus medinensis TaxID=318479 RepID=A0A0N4U9W6_DRAME|nr:unnamed protein product [Dracunculus medinensis]